ncbi:glycosyltransferase [Pelovirga terrestris]|uniref:Glycosyltransferase n=1 Tax=Pelovirga terrestris TaxID=2771352 RepID=A0A8J6QZQ1_9BACT|nr:glycosyltransferase [Pelovirga terrestris]MBD1401547.1 glycosyltransferase [Pelovirga terrestris]
MLFWVNLGILIIHLLITFELIYAARHLINLRQVTPLAPSQLPSLSIIVAARNEEEQMEAALRSLLLIDYPEFEVIVVNDRSSDGTGNILAQMTINHPQLKTLTIDDLPGGWLGKNHALWQGSRIAGGKLLLFTDADIIMVPETLQKAVSLLEQQQIDHLAVSPGLKMPGMLLTLLAACFGFFFGLYTRPWKVADPRNRCHIGVGAFNLVRTCVYRQIDGHRRIRLRPDDDLKLGKIVKDAGYRQQFAYGHELISVQWYGSIKEMIVGLEKNLFAGSDYRIGATVGGIAVGLTLFVWPYVALLLTSGLPWLLSLLSVLSLSLLLGVSARRFNTTRRQLIGFPFAVLVLCAISLRTMTLNLLQGGIFWRGTFYRLAELRKNRV